MGSADTGFTNESVPDQSGRIAVVTGANGGLGLETARVLAGKGAHVILGARDQSKAVAALASIRADHPDASAEIVQLDLASLGSVRVAAATIAAAHPRIDLLVNNAGLMATPEQQTVEGFEMQFGVNHLGHWVLTANLLEPLLAAPAARVVTVTSVARFQGRPVDPENPHLRGSYDPWRAYGQSKLANYHFGIGLQRRFAAAGASAISVLAHPGLTNSDLQSRTVRSGGAGSSGPFWERAAARIGMTVPEGALPQLRAATDPAIRGGEIVGPRWVFTGEPVVRTPRRPGADAAIETLWDVSERETGDALEVPTR